MGTAVFIAGLLCGIAQGEASFEPTPAEQEVPALFRLAAARFPYETELLRTTDSCTVWAVRFPSPMVSPVLENNTVHAEYFRPTTSGRHPGVVVLHILGADFALSRFMAARLADGGAAALFVKLPYYGERRPAGDEHRFFSSDVGRSLGAMVQGVGDIRRAAAWLAGRPEIDPDRLGVAGISLGGSMSALAASADPTLNQAALLLAGGDLAEILWSMPEAKRFRDVYRAAGGTKAQLAFLTRRYDPLTYAHRLKGKKVMMVAGSVDETIPPRCVRALWEAAGRPPLRWIDCGHYSAVGYLLPEIRRTVAFFADGR
jgi:dienelactone hydrolase